MAVSWSPDNTLCRAISQRRNSYEGPVDVVLRGFPISARKMSIKHHVEGYDDFFKYMESFDDKCLIVVLYSGTKLPNGQSWCSDCVEAQPFIEKGVASAPQGSHFVHVEVGDRAFWKDSKCPFRTNPKTRLNVLPTLAVWNTQKRLEGDQCSDVELIKMMLSDEAD